MSESEPIDPFQVFTDASELAHGRRDSTNSSASVRDQVRSSLPIQILGSSSSGNCALIRSGETTVLVDAGFSGKKLCALLATIGLSIDDIDAVLLTHEHTDHSQGFRGLCRHAHLTWICNRETFEAIAHPKKHLARWRFFETGNRFIYKDLHIEAFSLPHDAADPVGFLISWGGGDLFSPFHSLAWVLDLGHIPQLIKEKISKAQTLIIEANYDPMLLEADEKRPWSVKQRIQSRHGHLSNAAVAEFLEHAPLPYLKQVLLAHISKDCNSPEAIRKVFTTKTTIRERTPVGFFNPFTNQVEWL